jgi:hypothetical protein
LCVAANALPEELWDAVCGVINRQRDEMLFTQAHLWFATNAFTWLLQSGYQQAQGGPTSDIGTDADPRLEFPTRFYVDSFLRS